MEKEMIVKEDIGISFRHLGLKINEEDEETFENDLRALLNKYAGKNWSYHYRIEE